jgi:hypothetical protein
MSDTYGPMYETPLARWDRPTSSWRTCAATSLWDLPMSSLTLPTWGCLRGGELYALPTPEPATVEHAYLSLPTPLADNSRGLPNGGNFQSLPNAVLGLPTPKASDGERGRDLPRIRQDESGRELATAVGLLPTPRAMNGRNQTIYPREGPQNLENALALLPTPAVNDMGAGKDPQAWDEWAARQKAADGRPAPHGKSLEQEALRVGATTHQPLTAGSASWADLLQPLPFAEPIGTA